MINIFIIAWLVFCVCTIIAMYAWISSDMYYKFTCKVAAVSSMFVGAGAACIVLIILVPIYLMAS